MEKLATLLNELESKIPHRDLLNAAVSLSSAGWHIEHTLLVFNAIIRAAKESNPAEYKSKFSILKLLVFTMNKIPRSKANAPKQVIPRAGSNIERIEAYFALARTNLQLLDTLDSKSYFLHPVFGNLNLKGTKKMLIIHTKHHLDIITDIIKQG